MIPDSGVSIGEFAAIQVTTIATLLFLLTSDEQTYPNPTNLRELHHFYIGLLVITVGIVADVPTIRYLGAYFCADDAWQHSIHTMHRDPNFKSPLAWLYAVTLWRIPQRNVAMVFQDYALYPHLSVRENLAFPLKMRGTPAAARSERGAQVAVLLALGGLLERRPAQLSGGERQRVAMGRALVREPAAFLLDEPLSNLDAKLRGEVRGEIAALRRRVRTTMLYVTHDQVEALTLGDRVAVLERGRLQQVAKPVELYERPANRLVAGFIGSPPMNFAPAARLGVAAEEGAVAGIRPEHVALRAPGSAGALAATVEQVEALGHETLVGVRLAGDEPLRWVVREPGMARGRAGEPEALSVVG